MHRHFVSSFSFALLMFNCDNSKTKNMFLTFIVDRPDDYYFHKLEQSVRFKTLYRGRDVAILVDPISEPDKTLVPIVRTTSVYQQAAQLFSTIHRELLSDLQLFSPLISQFNNAMLERYTPEYRKMRFHSDQALDLDPEAHIVIFSCYDSPQATRRKLVIKDKVTKQVTQEIVLENNMAVYFSMEANRKYVHKIVPTVSDILGKWIGVTLRKSKTFVVHGNDGSMHLQTDNINQGRIYSANLGHPSQGQHAQFLYLRSQENKKVDFSYPAINYTVSPSDLLLPMP